jgi:ATP-dependent helicase/nuclease subunit A
MNSRFPDPGIAQRRAADPASSVWVGASAGTGKTKVLTDRVLALLLAGSPPEKLLCLTFTKAAASEMANRIAARLAAWATAEDRVLEQELTPLLGAEPSPEQMVGARRLFARLLDTPGGMRIETIHAFCQSLLRRFPLEAGLAPHFQVMDDRDSAELLMEAREEMLAAAEGEADLALVTSRLHEQRFPEVMAMLANERGRLLRVLDAQGGSVESVVEAIRRQLGFGPGDTAESLLARACADDAFPLEDCRAAMYALLGGKPSDVERGERMDFWLAKPEERAANFALWQGAFLTGEGEIRARLCTKDVESGRPGTLAILQTEAERVYRLCDALRGIEAAELTAALLRLSLRLIENYQRHKDRRALLDYDDLILTTIAVLQADGGAAWVLYKLDGGIDHLLIDEAQDTNPDQWAVIRALTDEFFAGTGRREAGSRTVFAVGDAKQSIYSFQRADPREFEASRALLAARVPAAGGRWDEVALNVSFRSTGAVLAAVDAVLAGEGGRGVADTAVEHLVWRRGMAGLVEMWKPVEPKPQDEDEPWKPPVERREGDNPRARTARLIAARIHQMIATGERLESKDRPITAGDVLVLVRRRGAFVDQLVKSLKRLGVAVAGADRMVLTEQLAVMDLMALAETLLLPEDDLTLATVLKGPLIGLTEEELFELAWNRPGSLWESLRKSRFTEAYTTLSDLARLADLWTPHDLFSHVLNRGGKKKLLARLGPEAEDPLDEFIGLTLAYEQMHPPSLQGFLHWLAQGGTEIKRDLDQGGGAIRIMTVHGAKGLQAPIVFLPDTLQKPKRQAGLLWLDGGLPLWAAGRSGLNQAGRDAQDEQDRARDAEYRRLLYVAMTRAEDRLYVCGWNTRHEPPEDCWYKLIEQGLRPLAEDMQDPFLARHDHDPAVLRLVGRQQGNAEPSRIAEAAREAAPLPAWTRATAPTEPVPPRPLAPSRPEVDPPARSSPASALLADSRHQGGRKRGSLIHRLLQSLPDLPPGQRAEAAVRFLGRSAWGLSYADQAEIAGEVARLMDDPTFAHLFGPGSRAEVPLIGQLGGRVVSGRVDRLVVRPDSVLVVDYKTDRLPPDEPPAAYLRQMAAYRGVLACLYPARIVRCALLWTDGPRWMPLDAAALDDALAAMALG